MAPELYSRSPGFEQPYRAAGFEEIGIQGHAFATNEFLPDAYGGSLVPLIEQYVARQEGAKDEATAWLADQRGARPPGRVLLRLHPVLVHRDSVRLALRPHACSDLLTVQRQ